MSQNVFSHPFFKSTFRIDNPTEVAPDDFRRWRPTDFAVESSVTPLNHFQNIQLTSEERINGGDDFELAT